jgi:3-dehydroquinate synthetase
LVGAFHQPRAIFMDTSYLLTLPFREFCNGMAEVIKTAVVSSLEEFEYLESNIEAIMAFARGETRHRGNILFDNIKISWFRRSKHPQATSPESSNLMNVNPESVLS